MIAAGHLVEMDVAPDPIDLGALRAEGVMFEPHHSRIWSSNLALGLGMMSQNRPRECLAGSRRKVDIAYRLP